MKFNNDKSPKLPQSEEKQMKSKHIVFDEDNDEITTIEKDKQPSEKSSEQSVTEKKTKKDKLSKKSEKNRKNAIEIGTMWYQVVSFHDSCTKPCRQKFIIKFIYFV